MLSENINNLRLKLKVPKKSRADEWFDEVGKLVNLLYVNFLNSESEEIAIHSLALIRLAAKDGSKEAKSKVIKLIRWVNKTPPSISKCILSKDESKLLIKDFSILKSEWVCSYIFEEIKICSKLHVNDYLEWLMKYSNSTNKLIEVLDKEYKKHKEEFTYEKELITLDFLMKKNLVSLQSYSEKELMHTAQFFEEILLKQKNSIDKESIAIKQYEIISNIIYLQPTIILESSFLTLLDKVRANVDVKSLKIQSSLNKISNRIVSLINYGIRTSEDDLFDIYKHYLEYLNNNLPKFKETLSPKNLDLLNNGSKNKQNTGAIKFENIDNIFISLFSSWRELKNTNTDKNLNISEQFEKNIIELVKIHSICLIGSEDEIVIYEPLKHLLDMEHNVYVTNVQIQIPGIAKIREDGSLRVISKAIVKIV